MTKSIYKRQKSLRAANREERLQIDSYFRNSEKIQFARLFRMKTARGISRCNQNKKTPNFVRPWQFE